MTNLSSIGHQLALARRASGLSQRELGEEIGVHQQQVARWEASDYRTASLHRVVAVAHALDLADELSAPVPAESPALYVTDTALDVRPVRDLGEIAARVRGHGSTFAERYSVERIGVFGSFATGDQRADSDVDVLVRVDKPGGFRFLEAAEFTERLLGRKVDFMRAETLKDELRPRILREAIWVWHA